LHWLLSRLSSFRERDPYYRVRLQMSLEIQDVRHGLADVSIRMGQGHWPGLALKELFSDELLVVAAPHFNGGQLPRSAEEIVAPLAERLSLRYRAGDVRSEGTSA
jgi:LysR family glycine cleavage system transcriptional activator